MSVPATAPSGDAANRLAAALGRMHSAPVAVGMAPVAELPESVPLRTGAAAAACAFWQEAAAETFAVGADHGACSIGRVTQGFAAGLPADDPMIPTMLETGYVSMEEIPSLRALPMGHAAIIYGPLAALPVPPAAAILLVTPAQLMLVSEALGAARLDAAPLRLMGRPTCAAIPAALLGDEPVASLACIGARIHAGLGDGELLLVVPAGWFDRLTAALEPTLATNVVIGDANRQRAAALAGA